MPGSQVLCQVQCAIRLLVHCLAVWQGANLEGKNLLGDAVIRHGLTIKDNTLAALLQQLGHISCQVRVLGCVVFTVPAAPHQKEALGTVHLCAFERVCRIQDKSLGTSAAKLGYLDVLFSLFRLYHIRKKRWVLRT